VLSQKELRRIGQWECHRIARDGFKISNGDGGCDYIGGGECTRRLLIIAALDD
jgi:hypothetical protein